MGKCIFSNLIDYKLDFTMLETKGHSQNIYQHLFYRQIEGTCHCRWLEEQIKTNIAAGRCHKFAIRCFSSPAMSNMVIHQGHAYMTDGKGLYDVDLNTHQVRPLKQVKVPKERVCDGNHSDGEETFLLHLTYGNIFEVYRHSLLYAFRDLEVHYCGVLDLKDHEASLCFYKKEADRISCFTRVGEEVALLDYTRNRIVLWNVMRGNQGEFSLCSVRRFEVSLDTGRTVLSTKLYLIAITEEAIHIIHRSTGYYSWVVWTQPFMTLISVHAKKNVLIYSHSWERAYGITMLNLETLESKTLKCSFPFKNLFFVAPHRIVIQGVLNNKAEQTQFVDLQTEEVVMLNQAGCASAAVEHFNKKLGILVLSQSEGSGLIYRFYDLNKNTFLGSQSVLDIDSSYSPLRAYFDEGTLFVAYSDYLFMYDYRVSSEDEELKDQISAILN